MSEDFSLKLLLSFTDFALGTSLATDQYLESELESITLDNKIRLRVSQLFGQQF